MELEKRLEIARKLLLRGGVTAAEAIEAFSLLTKAIKSSALNDIDIHYSDGDFTSYVPRFGIQNNHFNKTLVIDKPKENKAFCILMFYRRCFMALKTFVNLRFERR